MTETKLCCVFLLVIFLTRIPSGCPETISKYVCLEDSVQLFQNVSFPNRTRTIVINQIYGDAIRQIAKWFMNDSVIYPSVDNRFEKIISLDKYGNVWMRNVQHSSEGRYILLSTDDTGAGYVLKVDLIVMVAPSLHCKPDFELDDTHLIAFLNANACGRPPASAYWLGYNKQNVITVQPGKEAGPYHACIESPSLRCAKRFKATDYCSSFRRGPVDDKVLPKIYLAHSSIPESSLTLECKRNEKSAEGLSWRRNGISINNNAKFLQINDSLFIKHLNNDDLYDVYTCLGSDGRFESDPYSIETYGPVKVVLDISNNTTDVYQFSSTTVSCSADCFPPCSFRWTFSYTDTVTEGAELKILNVTSNGTVTCHATNPIIMNVTVSATIDIMLKSEDTRHKTPLLDKDREATIIDLPLIRYLLYVLPGIGGFVVIVAVVCCLRKKYICCSQVARLSNNTLNAHSEIGESFQEETLLQHYWTIVTNTRGEYCTALERNINVELRRFVDPAHSTYLESDSNTTQRHQNSEELEVSSHSVNSGIEKTSCSDSLEREGYINPIPSDPTKFNEYIHPRWSHSVELKEYIEQIPSDLFEIDVHAAPSPTYSKGDNESTNDSVYSNQGERDQYTDPAASDVMERDINTEYFPAVNIASVRHPDHISSDSVENGSCIDPSKLDTI